MKNMEFKLIIEKLLSGIWIEKVFQNNKEVSSSPEKYKEALKRLNTLIKDSC